MIPFLQDLVLKDFWLKLFSFALASLIWFTIKIAIKNDISPVASLSLSPSEQLVLRDLPIEILSQPDDNRRFTINPKVANITLEGQAVAMRNLRTQDVRVMVDLSDPLASLDFSRRVEVSIPPGVARVRIDPEEVRVKSLPKN